MATLVRWDPFREVAALQNEMGRFLTLFREGTGAQSAAGPQSWAPAMDVWETDGEIVYAFDLPGIPQDEISVEFEDGSLTVNAQRERRSDVSDDRLYRVERRFGSFTRTIGLPQGVTEDRIHASFADGVLEVHVGKPEQPKPRRIQIAGSENGADTIEGTSTPAA